MNDASRPRLVPFLLALALPLAGYAVEDAKPTTVRSRTTFAEGALVVELELVRATRPMYVASFDAERASFDALGLSPPPGWSVLPPSVDSAADRVALDGRVDLQPGKPVTLRFPMKHASAGSIKLEGLLEYGGGVAVEGEAFSFAVIYPCAVWREGPAWGGMPAECTGKPP